jgi:magnesium transporter
MDGLKRLQDLKTPGVPPRSSIVWDGPTTARKHTTTAAARSDALLQERLEELLVFEISKDGGQTYRNLTVRGLYKYVLAAITDRQAAKGARREFWRTSALKLRTSTANLRAVTSNSSLVVPPPPPNDETTTSFDPDVLLENPTPLGQTWLSQQRPAEVALATSSEEPDQTQGETIPPPVPSLFPWLRHRRTHSVSVLTKPGEDENVAAAVNPITYRERLGGYLHPRDMRKLITPFSSSNEPEIIVRRHVMLLNFDPLRAIILRDRLLVLVPDGADSLLGSLERKVRGPNEEIFSERIENSINPVDEEEVVDDDGEDENRLLSLETPKSRRTIFDKVFRKPKPPSQDGGSVISSSLQDNSKDKPSSAPGSSAAASEKNSDYDREKTNLKEDNLPEDDDDDDDVADDEDQEWDEMEGRDWIDLPFELQCLDAVLQCVTELLSDDTMELQQAVKSYIQQVTQPSKSRSGDDPTTIIRAVKDAIQEMTTRVNSFTESVTRCLDEDEDMALMNLSRLLTHPDRFIQPVPPEVLEEESDEPELILEAHLQDALTLANTLELLQGQIDSTSQLIDRELDATRNKILVATVLLTVVTVCLTVSSLVGAIFGMNLNSEIQNNPHDFLIVTFCAIFVPAAFGLLFIYVLIRNGTLQW